MSDRDLLELIASRLEGEEDLVRKCRDAFERCNEASRLNKETRERNIRAIDRATAMIDRLNHELSSSEDRAEISNALTRDIVRRVEVAGQRSDAWFKLLLGRTEALTEAVMRMIDRLDEGPATA